MAVPREQRLLRALPEKHRCRLQALILRKGTVITCPSCDAAIAETAEDILPLQRRSLWRFVMIQGGHEPDTRLNCAACGTSFVNEETGELWTKAGWQ